MKVRTCYCTLQCLALQHLLLLQTTMLVLSLTAAAHGAVRVPILTGASFEACSTDDRGEYPDYNFLSLKLPLFLAVNVEETSELFIQLNFQWVKTPLKISFDMKDDDYLQLKAEVAPLSSFNISLRNKGWMSIILVPSGENSLLFAVQCEGEVSKDGVTTMHSVVINDFSHVAAGQIVNVTSNFYSAIDAKCLRDAAEEASTATLTEESAQKVGSTLPWHVVVPVIICVVFIIVIIGLSALFIWQRYELKKRKNFYQQTILRKQEELQQFNHTLHSHERPQVPPRTPYNSSQRMSFHTSDDEEFRQLKPTGSGSGSETPSVAVHPKPRSYVRVKTRQQASHHIAASSDVQKREETKKQFRTFSQIIKGCSVTSKNVPPKLTSESKELSCMNENSNPETINSRIAEDEDNGGFNGPYWHHSLRQPPSNALKTYQV